MEAAVNEPPSPDTAANEPIPPDAPWEEPHLRHHPDLGPPEPAPWDPEAALLDEPPPEGVPGETETKPASEAILLEDPRFERLIKLFGGRLRKFYPDAPREAALEVSPAELEGEPD